MRVYKKLILSNLFAVLASSTAFAGVPTFSAANFAQNIALLLQAKSTYEEQIGAGLKSLHQLDEAYKQGAALAKGELSAFTYFTGDRTLQVAMNDYKNMNKALKKLTLNVNSIDSTLKLSTQISKKYGKTYDEYMKGQAKKAADKEEGALLEKKANENAIKALEESNNEIIMYSKNMPETSVAIQQKLSSQINTQIKMQNKLMEFYIRENEERQNKVLEDNAAKLSDEVDKSDGGKLIEEKNKRFKEANDRELGLYKQ